MVRQQTTICAMVTPLKIGGVDPEMRSQSYALNVSANENMFLNNIMHTNASIAILPVPISLMLT
jgi:uncharacterized membrane protein SpoIIM required for sporulation